MQAVSTIQPSYAFTSLMATSSDFGEVVMHSALAIVAFSQGRKSEGIKALLEVALATLDEEGLSATAIHVDMALSLLKLHEAEEKVLRAAVNRAERRKPALH